MDEDLQNQQDSNDENDQALSELAGIMHSVDTDTDEAQMNSSSMDDNNGGRIEFNEDDFTTIKGEE